MEDYDRFKFLLGLVRIPQIMQEHWWIDVGLGFRGFIRFWLKIADSKCGDKIQDQMPSQNLDSYYRTEDGVKFRGINSEDKCSNIIQYLNAVFECSDETEMQYLTVEVNNKMQDV